MFHDYYFRFLPKLTPITERSRGIISQRVIGGSEYVIKLYLVPAALNTHKEAKFCKMLCIMWVQYGLPEEGIDLGGNHGGRMKVESRH